MNHRRFERGRKAHRLTIFGQNGRNPANRRKESHVQHAVCFVKHQHAKVAEINQSAIEEIFESARSRHDYSSSIANGAELLSFGQASDDQSRR